MVGLILSGCATPPSALALLPVTGASTTLQVHEYPVAEQSKDNPTRVEFQQRAQAAVSAQPAGWQFSGAKDGLKAPNQAMAPFHYRLATNPTPPFSAFALYHGDQLIVRDIARFWPIALKNGADGPDFMLAYETLAGQKQVLSQDGIHDWIDVDNAPGPATSGDPAQHKPSAISGDQLAYAQTTDGAALLPAAGAKADAQAGDLHTWVDQAAGNAAVQQHWAMQKDGRVVMDGKDLSQIHGYSEIFNWQLINGQPFYFYSKNAAYHLNYAGRDLQVQYDQIIHGNTGDTAIFNPGSQNGLVWFYALRDGLWYYVEVGNFN